MPVSGDASSTTKSAIEAGATITITGNQTQDLSKLSRDTGNSLNVLGKIFDKESVQEKQELAKVFGEEAFKAVGDLASKQRKKALDDAKAAKEAGKTAEYNEAMKRADSWAEGGTNKILLHALAGGIMSDLGGNSFATGAASAGLNEAVQGELAKIKDPGLHQLASALVGAVAAKVVGGNAAVGASVASSATKNNWLSHTQQEQFANKLKAALDTGNDLEVRRLLAEYTALSQYNYQYVYSMEGKLEATDGILETQLLRLGSLSNNGLNVNLTNLSAIYGLNEQVALNKNNFISGNNNSATLNMPSSLGGNQNYVVEQTKLLPQAPTPPEPARSTGDQLLDQGTAALGYDKNTGAAIAMDGNGNVYPAPGRPSRGDVLYQQGVKPTYDANGIPWAKNDDGTYYPIYGQINPIDVIASNTQRTIDYLHSNGSEQAPSKLSETIYNPYNFTVGLGRGILGAQGADYYDRGSTYKYAYNLGNKAVPDALLVDGIVGGFNPLLTSPEFAIGYNGTFAQTTTVDAWNVWKAGSTVINASTNNNGSNNTNNSKPDFKTSPNGVTEALDNGQHVLDRHVGLSDEELIARLNANPKITGASTFSDDLAVNKVVNESLKDSTNINKINTWLANGAKGNLPLTYEGTEVIGRGVSRGSSIIEDMTNAKVILKGNGNGGYDILTSYPTK